jgi:uncharacterized protein DUF4326
MHTKVIHVRNRRPGDVYIGRAGRGESGYFGNPFTLGMDGSRDEVIAQYREYFAARMYEDAEFRERIEALRGKRLACFCAPQACHGNVIAEHLNTQAQG